MTSCPCLETPRLVLRPLTEADLDAYTEMLQTGPVRRSLHLPDNVGRWDAWAQMVAWVGQWELRGTGQWALEDRSTGDFIGRAGLHNPPRHDWPGVEVGWALHPDHWGRGYATEAGERAVQYAFTALTVPEVFSLILPENARSIAVAQRLGFSFMEERVVSHFPASPHGIWRLRRSEWAGLPA
jgi:[ribosomal protein S5]-alanine N-acetyltransferase